jgi:hypothetical protein
MATFPLATEGMAPINIPVLVFLSVQPEPEAVISQVSVPCPMSTSLPPSVRHAPSGTLQMVKSLPEAANLNSWLGFVPAGLPLIA